MTSERFVQGPLSDVAGLRQLDNRGSYLPRNRNAPAFYGEGEAWPGPEREEQLRNYWSSAAQRPQVRGQLFISLRRGAHGAVQTHAGPWSLHPASTTGRRRCARPAGFRATARLILSAPAAAIEPDVTGSIPQPHPLADAEVGRSPRFRSIASIHAKLTELGLTAPPGA